MIEFIMIYFQFHEIPSNQNLIKFLFVPEKYLGSLVLISVNDKVISYFRSSGGNVRCMIEFIMTSGNSLQSKFDPHKLYFAFFSSSLTLHLGPAQDLKSSSLKCLPTKTFPVLKRSGV